MKQHRLKYIILFLMISVSFLSATPTYFLIVENDSLQFETQDKLDLHLNNYLLQSGNKGYPFTELIFDSYNKINENEYFHYRLNKGEQVQIDTVVFGDYSQREVGLLSRYIDLPEDGHFHYNSVMNMIEELKSNPLIEVNDKADIYNNGLRLYTKAKQNIRFDAMAAYKEETDSKGIVGNLALDLINLGGLGRSASFHWSQPTLAVNSIDLSYTEPYIFNRSFSASVAFSQRYEDSSYVKRDLDLSLLYHIDQRSTLSINYINEYIGSSEDGSDSLFTTQNRSASKVGINWYSKPGKINAHIYANSSLHFSNQHRISKNNIEANLKYRGPLLGINVKLMGAYAISENPIANYDQYKLGGARFLRGAYFEQYISPAYLGWSLESGYFRDMNIFLFYDGAIINGINKSLHHFGLGISIPTGNNKLTLALGLDSQEDFSSAKFHVLWGI